jgi:hypothetical protein
MERLTEHDLEYAWDEAFEYEYKSLVLRSAHATEELRMLRTSLLSKKKEHFKLCLELGKAYIIVLTTVWCCSDIVYRGI